MLNQTKPPMSRAELDDLRWLGREAVAEFAQIIGGGGGPAGVIADVGRLLEVAIALGALGSEWGDSAPETADDSKSDRWPAYLDDAQIAVLDREAESLSGCIEGFGVEKTTGRSSYREALLERIERARSVLRRFNGVGDER